VREVKLQVSKYKLHLLYSCLKTTLEQWNRKKRALAAFNLSPFLFSNCERLSKKNLYSMPRAIFTRHCKKERK